MTVAVSFCASLVALYLRRLPRFEPFEFGSRGKVLASAVAALIGDLASDAALQR